MGNTKGWTSKKTVVIGAAAFAVLLLVYIICVATGNIKPSTLDGSEESRYTTAKSDVSKLGASTVDTTAVKTTISQATTVAPTTRVSSTTGKTLSTTVAPTEPQNTIRLLSITSPIGRNETATLRIQGAPNTEYSISVFYSSAASEAAGLEDKVSDSNGVVEWSWKIGGKTKAGEHRIVIIKGGGENFETSIVTTEG